MATHVFDYLVIGGGSGGIASARRAASYGAKVAVIEMGRLGGTCVNVGCVPKKVMWNTSSINEAMHDAKAYGYDLNKLPSFNWKELKLKRDAYVQRLNGIYSNNLSKDGVMFIKGVASFVDNNTIKVNDETYTGKHILVTSGSKAWIPHISGSQFGVTSDGFFELEFLPKKVAIVGAGYIAIELAGIFSALGSQVSLFIREGEFLRNFDSIIKEGVMQSYKDMGIEIVDHSLLESITNANGANIDSSVAPLDLTIAVHDKKTKLNKNYSGYECLIWAVGREADVGLLQLHNTTVKKNEKGFILADEYQQTASSAILALGDVCGIEMLTPVAIAAGRKLSDRLFGGKHGKLDYENIPSVIFSHPVAGSIGLSEHEALAKYGAKDLKIYQSKFVDMFYAMTDHKPKTHYKIVCQGKNERVVGLHLFGKGSDEILQGFGVAIRMGATKADFDNCVAIHPSASEEMVTMR